MGGPGKILLGSGNILDFNDLVACDVTIEDVAYGLAYSCRFAGQCKNPVTGARLFYSVAEHCVRMSHAVPNDNAYDALMHEVGEAFCGDVPGPMKQICDHYRKIEKDVEGFLMKKFGVGMRNKELIKKYDWIMLATEVRDLMPNSKYIWNFPPNIYPLPCEIVPWSPEIAANRFIERFEDFYLS